jgi:hypothetical protein
MHAALLTTPSVREMLASGYPVSVIVDVHREWINACAAHKGRPPGEVLIEVLMARLERMTPEERAAHQECAAVFCNIHVEMVGR